jgi:hypothetical protein
MDSKVKAIIAINFYALFSAFEAVPFKQAKNLGGNVAEFVLSRALVMFCMCAALLTYH